MTPLKDWRDSDLSALFDDELLADEAQNCVAGVAKNQTMLTHWCDYQDVRAGLQGEVMHASSSAFLTGFRERLAQEQTQPEAVVTVPQSGMPAANDAVFRWKLVAGLASCASVAVLAWSLIGQSQAPTTAPMLAQSAPPMRGFASPQAIQSVSGFSTVAAQAPGAAVADAAEQSQVMLRDPALDEFLRAHGSQAGSVMENTAGFMRNATFGGEGL